MYQVKKRVVKTGSSLLRSRSRGPTKPAGVQAAAVAVLVKHQIQAGMQGFKEKKPADLLYLETKAENPSNNWIKIVLLPLRRAHVLTIIFDHCL